MRISAEQEAAFAQNMLALEEEARLAAEQQAELDAQAKIEAQ